MCHRLVIHYYSSAATSLKNRMHIHLALVYMSLVVVPGCSSLRTKRDTINSIINISQITLVHIKKLRTKFSVTPQIEFTPSIQGLTSISHDLGLLDNELQSSFTGILQIQADVSSLEGRVRSFALAKDCPIQARPAGQSHDNSFPDSRLYMTLMKVQLYLEVLLHNKDKLKVC